MQRRDVFLCIHSTLEKRQYLGCVFYSPMYCYVFQERERVCECIKSTDRQLIQKGIYMKKYVWIVLAAGMIVLFIGAGVLYNNLSSGFQTDGFQVEEKSEIATENATETKTETESEPTQENQNPAPDVTLEDLEGNKVKISDLKGKPVVLNFWASWCPPCKSEMPGFENLYQEYGDKIQFVMVNLTDGGRETKDTAMKYVNDMGYTFPIYFDTDMSAALAYNAVSIPITYLIDSDGNIVAYASGAVEEEALREGIQMILP